MNTIQTREIHGHTVEIVETMSKTSRTGRPLVIVEGKVDGQWADGDWRAQTAAAAATSAIGAITRRLAPAEPTPAPASTGRTGWSKYSGGGSSVDRMMANLTGVSSPAAARGECHYCGQALRRGHCPECS